MEHDIPHLPNDDDDDDDSDTNMEVMNLVETCITHLGEASGELPMDKNQTPVVFDSLIHSVPSPSNVTATRSSPPQAS